MKPLPPFLPLWIAGALFVEPERDVLATLREIVPTKPGEFGL